MNGEQVALAYHQYLVARVERRGVAEGHRLEVEGVRGADQAEAGFVVVADDVGGDRPPVGSGDLHEPGLEDHVTDRQDQPVLANDDAGAFAQEAERVGRARVRRYVGAHADDGVEDVLRANLRRRLARRGEAEGGEPEEGRQKADTQDGAAAGTVPGLRPETWDGAGRLRHGTPP